MTYCESFSLPRVTLQGWFGRGLIVVPKEIGGALAIAPAVTPTRVRMGNENIVLDCDLPVPTLSADQVRSSHIHSNA